MINVILAYITGICYVVTGFLRMDKSKDEEIAKSDYVLTQESGKKLMSRAQRITRIVEIGCIIVAGVILLVIFTWHIARLQFPGINKQN